MNTKKHEVPQELLTSLLANYKKPEDLIGENGLLKQLTKLLVEKALDAELTEHLGHERHESVANASGNTRNGKSKKTLKGDFGELPIEVPRDRHGSFEPQLIPKHQTHWAGFDDKIISLYARGMTVREIQSHLQEMYGAEVSPSLISSVTDAVSEEVKVWQARPLDAIYPIVYLDCIHVKVREGAVRVKAVYLAIGINMAGEKEVLGLWLAQTEGAKFWLQVVTELRNRGVQDIFIACVDGLKGFADAIEAVFPKAVVQLCIVHMVRHSLNYVSWKRRPEVAADLRHIVLRLPAGNPQGHLHHQRHRVGEHEPEEADQESGFIPQRRGADQAVLSGPAKHQPEGGRGGGAFPRERTALAVKSPRIPEPVRSRGWGTV
jgi:putative transposase